MNRKNILKEIYTEFHTSETLEVFKRNLDLPVDTGKIITITGVRRCGKTFLLYDTIGKLLKMNIDKRKIIYINFEDERLDLKTDEMDLILQSYRELYPDVKLRDVYFFFDEIQNMAGWEKFIRRVYDNYGKNIYLTGSNSKSLAMDIATALRGRTLQFELFPLSFDEYLRFRKIDANFFKPVMKAKINQAFDDYLHLGGFPETVFTDVTFHRQMLREYFYVMLYKDLIERYNISNTSLLKFFITRISSNLTSSFTISKIYNEIKSMGLKADKNFVYELVEYTRSIYLTFILKKFDYSITNMEKAEKKLYFVDNGLINAITWKFSKDIGKLFENALAIYLFSKYSDQLFFYKGKSECDFVIFDRDKPSELIQVAYDISDERTLNRELKGINDAAGYFNIDKALIITSTEEKQIEHNGLKISVVPACKYFIEK